MIKANRHQCDIQKDEKVKFKKRAYNRVNHIHVHVLYSCFQYSIHASDRQWGRSLACDTR